MHVTKFGIYASLISAAASIGYTIVQILQIAGITHSPLDDILIYAFSLCIAPSFLLAILSLYYVVHAAKKFWIHAALLFAVLYNAFVMLMYVVQLTSIIPYHVTDATLVVSPHSFFWVIDALGYINMGIASLFLVPVFSSEKWTRWFFLAHAAITPLVALVYFYPKFSVSLLMLASPWSITAPGCMIALSVYLKKAAATNKNSYTLGVNWLRS